MTSYRPGDLVLVAFPFSAGGQVKRRPALVILDNGDADIVVARVTTRVHPTPFDANLTDWQSAGLLAPSVARLHKLATLERTLVDRKRGQLSAKDHAQVASVLRRAFGAW
jgi:mRNA interferase MazF